MCLLFSKYRSGIKYLEVGERTNGITGAWNLHLKKMRMWWNYYITAVICCFAAPYLASLFPWLFPLPSQADLRANCGGQMVVITVRLLTRLNYSAPKLWPLLGRLLYFEPIKQERDHISDVRLVWHLYT